MGRGKLGVIVWQEKISQWAGSSAIHAGGSVGS